MYDRLVIAIDGSDEAENAARRGLELARVLDANVYALYVVEQKALRLTETADEKTQLRESGEAILDEIEALASEPEHPVTTKPTEGKPAVQIISVTPCLLEFLYDIFQRGFSPLTELIPCLFR